MTAEVQQKQSPLPSQSEIARLLDTTADGSGSEPDGSGSLPSNAKSDPSPFKYLKKPSLDYFRQKTLAACATTEGKKIIGMKRVDDWRWSDVDSIGTCSTERSSLLPGRSGASMDLATQRANELSLAGRQAVEAATNMR